MASQFLKAEQDGWFITIINEIDESARYTIGFSQKNQFTDWSDIAYGFYYQNGALRINEGRRRLKNYGKLALGDILKIERTGNLIKYYRNEQLLKVSQINALRELSLFATIKTTGKSIAGVYTSNCQTSSKAQLELSTNQLDFGSVPVGKSISKEITIKNSGDAPLNITGIEFDNGAFSGNWEGIIPALESKKFTITFSPLKATSYSSNMIVKSNSEVENNTVTLKGKGKVEILIEAEDHFEIVEDVGARGRIKTRGDSDKLSNQLGVQIFDKGDKIRIKFNVATKGIYELQVRLRSGNDNNNANYWPNGYAFSLNGSEITMLGEYDNISRKDAIFGGTYWGIMSSELIELDAGNHSLDITALKNWALVDYLYIKSIDNSLDKKLQYTESVAFGEITIGNTITKKIAVKNISNQEITVSKTAISDNFSGTWRGEIPSGETRNILVQFTPEEEKTYNGLFEIIINDTEKIEIPLSGIGKAKPLFNLLLEAEHHYNITADVGTKGKVKPSEETSTVLSNKQAVQLYDKGDKFNILFSVPQTNNYIIKVRLRVGGSFGGTSYIPEGYAFKINNSLEKFSLLEDSTSQLHPSFGQSTWGLLESRVLPLFKGQHTFEVEAIFNWALVDYIELTEVESSSRKQPLSEITEQENLKEAEKELNEVNVSIYPNPVSDILVIDTGSSGNKSGKITLFKSTGEAIYSEEISSSYQEYAINVKTIKKGFYLLNVQVGSYQKTKRIIIE